MAHEGMAAWRKGSLMAGVMNEQLQYAAMRFTHMLMTSGHAVHASVVTAECSVIILGVTNTLVHADTLWFMKQSLTSTSVYAG